MDQDVRVEGARPVSDAVDRRRRRRRRLPPQLDNCRLVDGVDAEIPSE